PKAIEEAKKAAGEEKLKNIEFIESDLFEKVSGKFDLIFINPPYLPGRGEACLCGGKRGQEVTERFLKEAANYLEPGGKALVLLSSFNDVDGLKKKYGLKILGEKKMWFETLFCAETTASKGLP
ncbi:MAG: methyltransferase, partial [Candidatus Aenigmatarchaeota archaeon]